jgi:SAM-dependent methyltransferase
MITDEPFEDVQPDGSRHRRCLLCQSRRLKPLAGYESARLVRCGQCRFVFSGAVPTAAELREHYEGYGRDDYLSPLTARRYHELLDRFESSRVNNRILDVGCGVGRFPGIAKERGWNVYGTELTDRAVEMCARKGITMHKGKLDPANYGPDFFDVVTSVETIEHINNPVEDANNMAAVLRPRGLLYVTTPNFNSLSRRLLRGRWNIIEYPEHLCYYTPKTITALLRGCGFERVEVRTTGVSLTRWKTSLKMSDEKLISAGSGDERVRVMLEGNRALRTLKRLLNYALTASGSGDSMKVTARKA